MRAGTGSAPAPSAVFRALAKNLGRTKIFRAFVPASRAGAKREGAFRNARGGRAPAKFTSQSRTYFMTTARDTIVDALDIESFVLCESEKEAKELVGKLMQSLG